MGRRRRDVERNLSAKEFVRRLRRLADALEAGERVRLQVAGERIRIPATATLSIEHERGSREEEIEFQIKWALAQSVGRERRPTSHRKRQPKSIGPA
ncbi:MAG TPA: amphi-Trp domain-containing protein [Blastocatellia bacterium]|nr:amphi-Trp domain-containing protein [Blastocatellia bacterium]